MFNGSTEHEYLIIVDKKHQNIIKERALLKDLSTKVQAILLDKTMVPDIELS